MKSMVGQGSDGCTASVIALSTTGVVSVPRVSSRMCLLRCPARTNFSTRNLATIGFVVVVPMVVASQGSIALVRIYSHWRGPFKIGVVPDKG